MDSKEIAEEINAMYDTHFKEYYKNEFGTEEFFKSEVDFVLNYAYTNLIKLKESNVSINQYERDIKALGRKLDEIQRYSENIIFVEFPLSHSEIFYFMSNLLNMYNIKESIVIDVFKIIFDSVFPTYKHKKPKITTRIKQREDRFFNHPILSEEITEKWKTVCNQNPNKTIDELIKIFNQKE